MDIYISKIIQFSPKNVKFWKTDLGVTKIFFFLAVKNKNFKCSISSLLYRRPESVLRLKTYGADQKLSCLQKDQPGVVKKNAVGDIQQRRQQQREHKQTIRRQLTNQNDIYLANNKTTDQYIAFAFQKQKQNNAFAFQNQKQNL